MNIHSYLVFLLFFATGCAQLPFGSKGVELGIKFTQSPTFAQVNAERKDETVINGTPVKRSDYPEVLLIKGSGGCTASLIGPRAVLTAAHCVDNGKKITFTTLDSQNYTAICEHHPDYDSDDHDMALCDTNRDITNIKPVQVVTEREATKGQRVQILGFGCTQPGGSGGNDGILRTGYSVITAGQGRDLVLETPGGAALCFGDSGGPIYTEDGRQIAVNSKGNIKDKSWVSRTDRWAVDWMKSWGERWNAPICGINISCDSTPDPDPIPDPEPQPKSCKPFSIDTGVMDIKGDCK